MACDAPNPPPAGFVDLSTKPAFELRIGYATETNFTGAPLPGYGWPGAWLAEAPAAALERVAATLAEQQLRLVIFDAYRPRRASREMGAWAERIGRTELLGVYISRTSGHNDGGSVDVGLADLATGEILDMGAPWDTFDATAHTHTATGEAATRRALLASGMVAAGWSPYWREWWHFRFDAHTGPPLDVPYGACEAGAG